MVHRLLASLLALTALAGCESFDHLPWKLDRTRVLAMRVEVVGDEERSIPAPGERIRVRGLVVDAGEDRSSERRWTFGVCLASSETRVGLSCAEPPFTVVEGTGEVEFELDTPQDERLLLASGSVCHGGAPRCEGAIDAEAVVFVISTSGTIENRHPQITASPKLGGEPWPEAAGCADERALRWPAARVGAIEWDLGGQAREPIDGIPEELLVSHATTHGELDRYYSLVEPTEPSASIAVNYVAPELADIPPEGIDVRFVFVVRDERGGVTWLRRTLCVTRDASTDAATAR